MAGAREYQLLDEFYDKNHRARAIEDNPRLNLPILWARTHDGFQLMRYDHRYTTLLQRAGLHVVAQVVRRGLPNFNAPALTALVDRWRPETHSFHLPCGEMTVTLQDVAMFFGLGIRGLSVIGSVVADGWRGRVEQFLGTPPPAAQGEEARRGRVSGVPMHWLRETFAQCPEHADEGTNMYYCRAWVLNLFGSVLFPDTMGDSASWMYIHCLWDWDEAGMYSWGSTELAFL